MFKLTFHKKDPRVDYPDIITETLPEMLRELDDLHGLWHEGDPGDALHGDNWPLTYWAMPDRFDLDEYEQAPPKQEYTREKIEEIAQLLLDDAFITIDEVQQDA